MKKLTFLFSALILASTSYGQVVLISWDMNGVDVNDNWGPAPYTLNGTTGTNIDSGALTLGSGVNPSTSAYKYGFKVSGGDGGGSLANSITNDYYMQFTLTAAEGYTFSLTTIDMNGEATGAGADNVVLMSDVDGFTAGNEIATATGVAGASGGFDTDSGGFGGAIDVSGAQYQNLSSITFRIYGWNIDSGSGSTRLRNLSGNDLVINGTTAMAAVPEPSTYALLLGAATLGFCAFRRRARH